MSSTRRAVLALVLASLALRVVLVFSGGQLYWPDERRYEESRAIVAAVFSGEAREALARLDSADHLFFKIAGTAPAIVERAIGDDPRIPALFFSLFSVADIALVAALAGRLGASSREIVMACALLAMSSTYFYYARHLLPYDVSATLGLAALFVGLARPSRVRDSLACGVLAAFAFFTYAGYWTLAAAAMLLPVLDAADRREAVRRAVFSGIAALGTVAAVLALAAAAGSNLLTRFVAFAGTVVQGDFGEGWRLPFEYLWHAEHALLLVWLAALAYWLARLPEALRIRQVRVALAGVVFVYACLAIASTLLHAFVVYGRLARQLVPFLCLLAAAGLERLWTMETPSRRRFAMAVLALVALQAVLNFAASLRITFPADFLRAAVAAGHDRVAGSATVNVRHLWPLPAPFALPPGHVTLMQAPHPLEFRPYQYEGYDPAQRNFLRTRDIRMRVIAPAP